MTLFPSIAKWHGTALGDETHLVVELAGLGANAVRNSNRVFHHHHPDGVDDGTARKSIKWNSW